MAASFTAPQESHKHPRMPSLSSYERASLLNRLNQIDKETHFPGLRDSQRYSLVFERLTLLNKLTAAAAVTALELTPIRQRLLEIAKLLRGMGRSPTDLQLEKTLEVERDLLEAQLARR
jgi:hypothetical protein